MNGQEGGVTRRKFLVLTSGVAAVGACSSGPVGPDAIGDVATGITADMLAAPALEPLGSTPAAIGRDADGVYAMTLTCPHMGCNIATTGTVELASSLSQASIKCGTRSCGHGSMFDANGTRLAGPAPGSLQHFAVSQDANGAFVVHGGQFVDATTRLKV